MCRLLVSDELSLAVPSVKSCPVRTEAGPLAIDGFPRCGTKPAGSGRSVSGVAGVSGEEFEGDKGIKGLCRML